MTPAKLFGEIFSSKEKTLTRFDQETALSKHIPITHFNMPNIYETRSGALGFIIKVSGVPFEVTGSGDLNYLQSQWAFIMRTLGDEFAVFRTTYRHEVSIELEGNYPEGFAKDFTNAYEQKFINKPLFVNDIYLNFLLKGSSTKIHQGISFLQKIGISKDPSEFNEWQETRIRKVKNTITSLMTNLSRYTPKLLGIKEENGVEYSEILSFFSILVNGDERKFLMPHQDIASYIPQNRVFFGSRAIHFEGLSQGRDKFAAIVSLKDYYPKNKNDDFNTFLSLPFSYINTHSFMGIDKNQSQEMIRKQTARMTSVGDKSLSQIEELEQAADDIASDRINFGYHHNTVLVFGESVDDLEDKVAKTIQAYMRVGIVAIRETLNLENAFWAQIPGNFKYIRRSSPISSQNFSCFTALHNFYIGYVNGNHLGSAVGLAETKGKAPFYFNVHEEGAGSKVDLPKGHFKIIGASNAGKTVVMLSIEAMMKKYGGRSFIFDRNRGCDIYVRAMGGQYCLLNSTEKTGWNPCQLSDNANNREFLRDFIKQLVMRPEVNLTAADENQIADVVDRNYSLPMAKRNLSNISSFFRLDFGGLDALSKWLRLPDRTGKSGEYAWIFDNETDSLNLDNDTMGFDMTSILGTNQDEKKDMITPVMMYFFHRIESSITSKDSAYRGKLTGVYLDEGWQFLRNPFWVKKLENYFNIWRKENTFICFATQQPDLVAKSQLSFALTQGTASSIFMVNREATEEDYMSSFGLSAKEFDFIKNTPIQDRYFLFKQGHNAAILKFDFTGMQKFLAVLSGNIITVSICDEVRAEYGDDPKIWLPKFYERVRRL